MLSQELPSLRQLSYDVKSELPFLSLSYFLPFYNLTQISLSIQKQLFSSENWNVQILFHAEKKLKSYFNNSLMGPLWSWSLDLQLPMQSVHITTNVLSSIPHMWGALNTTLCGKVCQWHAAGWWFFPGTPSIKLTTTI